MARLKFIISCFVVISPILVRANPFDAFKGKYQVTKVSESTCSFKEAIRENGACGGGWNLDRLNQVEIWKDNDPNSLHKGETVMTTFAMNALQWVYLQNEYRKVDSDVPEIKTPIFEHEVRVFNSYDKSAAIKFFREDNRDNGTSFTESLQISKSGDGSYQFVFQRMSFDANRPAINGYSRQVYGLRKVE